MSKELWFNMVTNNRYQQAYQNNYSRSSNQSTGNQTYNQSANTNTRGTTTSNAGLSDNRGNTSTNNNQLMVSCNACQNGYPVGITMAPPGQCPAGSTENKQPCGPLIDCAKCDNGYAIMSATRPYQQAGCGSLGAGWVNAYDAAGRYIDPCTLKDGLNNTNTPSGYLDCYDCNNQIMNRIDNTQSCQTSYPGSLTSVVSPDTGTSPNPCPPPPPSPDILCHTCSTGFPQSNLFQGQSCPEGWTTDMNPCGTSTGGGIAGCTNPSAYNYNSSATIDDGSCALPITPNPNLFPGSTPGPTCAEFPDMMGCPPVAPPPPVSPPVVNVDVEPQTAGLKDNKLLMYGLIGVVAYMLLKGKGITTTK